MNKKTVEHWLNKLKKYWFNKPKINTKRTLHNRKIKLSLYLMESIHI